MHITVERDSWGAAVHAIAAARPPGVGAGNAACDATRGDAGPLFLRTMLHGNAQIIVAKRRLVIDEDIYQIVNPARGTPHGMEGNAAAQPLIVCIDGALLPRMPTTRAASTSQPERHRVFREHLRSRGDAVGNCLEAIGRQLQSRTFDAHWWHRQIIALRDAAYAAEQQWDERVERIQSVKATTRRELQRRVLLASDFILSAYDEPITLGDVAEAASLSRFHLARLFQQVHGVTPHAFLLAKRIAVAQRLLVQPELDLNEIAVRSGFGSRSSMFRHLRARLGASGRALRSGSAMPAPHQVDASAEPKPCPTCA